MVTFSQADTRDECLEGQRYFEQARGREDGLEATRVGSSPYKKERESQNFGSPSPGRWLIAYVNMAFTCPEARIFQARPAAGLLPDVGEARPIARATAPETRCRPRSPTPKSGTRPKTVGRISPITKSNR